MLLIHRFHYPQREIDKPFLMPVEDVFSITGRGTVATGRIETGVIKLVTILKLSVWVLKNLNQYLPVLKCSVRFSIEVKLVTMLVFF